MSSDSNLVKFPWLKGPMDALSETPTFMREEVVIAIIRAYTAEVNRRAENKMLMTGKIEGSHHAAMREINSELGI